MIAEPPRVRVILLSPADRLLLIKYRNTQRSGTDHPIWQMAGGGRDEGETLEQTAIREVFEETGISELRVGPTVWYGEDGQRSGDWNILYKEHFIVALAPTEAIDRRGWTEHEHNQILDLRWWTLDEIRDSTEAIYPLGLSALVAPIFEGRYPVEIVTLPTI